MDRTTLKHYEERADKGKKLVEKIDNLKFQLSKLDEAERVTFFTSYDHPKGKFVNRVLTRLIANAAKAEVEKYIEKLEQELLDL